MIDYLYKYRFNTVSGGPYWQYLDDSQDPYTKLASPDGSSIVSGTVVVTETINQTVQRVDIDPEWVHTNQHFRAECIPVFAPGSGITYSDLHFPFPITILGAEVGCFDVDMPFNQISVWVGAKDQADTYLEGPIGYIVGTCSTFSGSTIVVDDTVLENVDVGHCVSLIDGFDPLNKEELGRVVEKSLGNKTLTMELPISGTFDSGLTLVRNDILVVKDMCVIGNGTLSIGYSVTKGSYLPANSTIRVKLHNHHEEPRPVSVKFEYYF